MPFDSSDDGAEGATQELSRGSVVGRYLIVGLVGRGGMGEVYAAYDPELDRKIALKLLRARSSAGVDASEGRARLMREAQAIARLSDPNVVVVYDVGTFGDRVFLAMEFVDGSSLGYWLHATSRSWREVVKTFLPAGRGLASAHRSGIVHRDFKPDNVMIDREGKVRVMDFGLARSIDGPASDKRRGESSSMAAVMGDGSTTVTADAVPRSNRGRSSVASHQPEGTTNKPVTSLPVGTRLGDQMDDLATRNLSSLSSSLPAAIMAATSPAASPLTSSLTMTGTMMGTPAYMAPEQFRGGAIDARTDQFSFCVALYEGLYGERPFEGRNLQDLTANVLKGRVRAQPSQARVPGWLRRCVLRGLRVDPEQRYSSMEELLAALARDPARAHRWWAASLSVAGLIALLSVGLVRANRQHRTLCLGSEAKLAGIWELPTAKGLTPAKEAVRQSFLATGKRYASDSFTAVVHALDKYVSEWNQMHRDSCEATNIRGEQSAEVLDLRTRCLTDRFSEVRALTEVFRGANADVVSSAVSAAQSLRPIEQCADIVALRAVLRPPDDPRSRRIVADLRARLAEAKALTSAGRLRKAVGLIEPIVEQARATEYAPVLAEALLQKATINNLEMNVEQAEKTFEAAIWAGEASRHDEVVVEAAAQLIWVVGNRQRRYEEGERWGRYSEAVLARLGPGHEVMAGWRANNLGTMYLAQGRFSEALAADLQAVALKTKALSADHYDVAISHANVSEALAKLGKWEEALLASRRALGIMRASVGAEHPSFAQALIGLAEVSNATGKHEEARAAAEQSLRILERELDSKQPIFAFCLMALGESLIAAQPAAAVAPFERALEIRQERDPAPELLGEARFALARALLASSRTPGRALQLAQDAKADYLRGPSFVAKVLEIERWIEEHGAGRAQVSMRW